MLHTATHTQAHASMGINTSIEQQTPNSHNIILSYLKKEYKKEYNQNLYNNTLNMQF